MDRMRSFWPPDGKSLYIVCGNMTKMVSPLGGLACADALGRRSSAAAHARLATASWPAFLGRAVASTISIPTARIGSLSAPASGTNSMAAFNRHGDLFTYDADMEWDMNTPWYRPTRV